MIQPGEETAQGNLLNAFKYLRGGKEDGDRLLSVLLGEQEAVGTNLNRRNSI